MTKYMRTSMRTIATACLAATICTAPGQAKTPRQMFETMPAELHIHNTVAMDSISPVTMRCNASAGTTMEMTALPCSAVPTANAAVASDTLFYLLTTRNTPESETTCDIYDQDWQRIKSIPLSPYATSLIAKPDTMGAAEYREIRKLIDLPLVEAHFTSKSPATLELSLHIPLLGKKDRQRMNAILVRKEYQIVGTELQVIDYNQ